MKCLCMENVTRGRSLVMAGRVADTMWTRLRRLMGTQPRVMGDVPETGGS